MASGSTLCAPWQARFAVWPLQRFSAELGALGPAAWPRGAPARLLLSFARFGALAFRAGRWRSGRCGTTAASSLPLRAAAFALRALSLSATAGRRHVRLPACGLQPLRQQPSGARRIPPNASPARSGSPEGGTLWPRGARNGKGRGAGGATVLLATVLQGWSARATAEARGFAAERPVRGAAHSLEATAAPWASGARRAAAGSTRARMASRSQTSADGAEASTRSGEQRGRRPN